MPPFETKWQNGNVNRKSKRSRSAVETWRYNYFVSGLAIWKSNLNIEYGAGMK